MRRFYHQARNLILSRKKLSGFLIIIGAVLIWAPTIYTNLSTRQQRYDPNKISIELIPAKEVAIVLGAGVDKQGNPTPYLRWRVETAVKLYQAHRVKKLLMTADNSTTHYNEPAAMRKLAKKLGVPGSDIVLDYAGFNTYDSCYRAHAIFEVKSAIVVTQGYHLPGAVLACNSLGVPSIGVSALHDGRDWGAVYIAREWISTDKILLELVFKPRPAALGQSEPITVK